MSNITMLLLSPGGWADDAEAVTELNTRLGGLRPHSPGYWELRNISDAAGGSKVPPALYAGALNSLPFAEFAQVVAALPWSNPEEFQVMVMFDGDSRYKALSLTDLRAWP
ncbi:hypothetical protein [Streptomyces sp. NPDC051994]|uniref:hypothetical protein n=1 Tax=unclassified Streptomyces TaxID=2593676 RepID=UPI003436375C